MLIYKRISYVQIGNEYQTYIHPVSKDIDFIRYKRLKSNLELEDAIKKCKEAGWAVCNATKIVNLMNSRTSKRKHRHR